MSISPKHLIKFLREKIIGSLYFPLLVMCVVMAIPYLLETMVQYEIDSNFGKTVGIVVEVRNTGKGPYMIYEYYAKGKRYTGFRSFGYKRSIKLGDTLSIEYSTKYPSLYRLHW